MPEDFSQRLSSQAFADLKEIAIEEFGSGQTDQEIQVIGLRLLRFFDMIFCKDPAKPKPMLSDEEAYAVLYINRSLEEGHQPTVRGIAEAMGRSSSRSGQRMMNSLIAQRFVQRDSNGKVQLQLIVTDQGIFLPA